MNIQKNCKLLSLLISVLFCAIAPGITLDSIRQAAQQLPKPSTMHIVAIEQVMDNRISEGNENTVSQGIKKANQYVVSEVNIFMDIQSGQAKEIQLDLRDINRLMTQFKIPNEKLNKINLTQSKIMLFKGGNSMIYTANMQDITLWKSDILPENLFDSAANGIIPEHILNSKGDINVMEYQVDGNKLVKIEIAYKTGINIIVECDPSIGYRYRSIKWLFNGQTTNEKIASDYREVDGIYYPFLFVRRSYSESGNIEYEYTLSVEEIRFGIKLMPDDFKIFAPPGTQITDLLVSQTASKIGTGRYLGIDDVIAIGRNRLQRQ